MKLISKETKTVKSAFNDEFENYLKKQQVKTTFNGYEIESFSWYKKALGLAQGAFSRDLGEYTSFSLKDSTVSMQCCPLMFMSFPCTYLKSR